MFQNILTFLKEVQIELKKVNWPTQNDTVKLTLIVIGVSGAIALFLGVLDFAFTFLMERFVI